MKPIMRLLMILAVALVSAAGPSARGQQSYDGALDISGLVAAALREFDTAGVDAIVLSEGQAVTWSEDGRLSVVVHRIVWINSAAVIRDYGDVRIPYDQERCSFTPLAVRVWREGQWWPSDSTGVVETLPFALDHAYDYSGLREVMLLLNGLEVPCVAEIAYRIEDRAPCRPGADGLWLSAGTDPGMESWFELAVPARLQPRVSTSGSIGSPERRSDSATGLDVWRWRVGPHGALPQPHTSDSAADVPHVIWSLWENWDQLGTFVMAGFRQDTVLEGELAADLDSLVRKGRTDGERARLIAGFIRDRVSFVDYERAYWWVHPRSASRIYNTAYGHRLDRAILAALLFGKAGLATRPVFLSDGTSPLESDVPSLARLGQLSLHVGGPGEGTLYRPNKSDIVDRLTASAGRTVWYPGLDSVPRSIPGGQGILTVRLDLAYDKSKGKFAGSGLLVAEGGLAPVSQVSGLHAELKACLASLAADLVKGAVVTDCNLERLDPAGVTAGFLMECPRQATEDTTRIQLTLGKLKGGIVDHLPGDVQLYQEDRSSTVGVPFPMAQSVEIRLDAASSPVVYLPESDTIENECGRFSVTSAIEDSQVVLLRRLELSNTDCAPAQWPLLRLLLLAETHEKNGTVILRAVAEEGKKK